MFLIISNKVEYIARSLSINFSVIFSIEISRSTCYFLDVVYNSLKFKELFTIYEHGRKGWGGEEEET